MTDQEGHKIEINAGKVERLMAQTEWDSIKKKEFPRKVRYWLGRIFNRIDQEMKPYFNEKQAVVDKYAVKNEDGSPVVSGNQVTFGDNRRLALAELDELGKVALDFGSTTRIILSAEDAELLDKVKLTVGEEMVLQAFVFQEGYDDV